VASGEVPFAVLNDGRVISARFRTTVASRPPSSLSDPETTQWTLVLDGREFAVAGQEDGGPGWLPISAAWIGGGKAPLSATADGDGHVVGYDYFYAHERGWVSGPVTLTFDVRSMTVVVEADLSFEPD